MDLGKIFSNTDSSVISLGLILATLITYGLGFRLGKRLRTEDCQPREFKFDDASLALLGLLLAFTFSMSLGKHDQRRIMVLSDSNAIGDFYTCASLLNEPMRTKLQTVIREYAEFRLNLALKGRERGTSLDEAALERALQWIQETQEQMTDLVAQAVNEGTPIAIPLANTLNELTSMHAARLAAVKDRLPPTIVLLLFAASFASTMLVGRQQGATGKPQLAATLSFILLVGFVVYVILDLNQPGKGLITVSQEPLERLFSSMAK
jgi:hypothetical protein